MNQPPQRTHPRPLGRPVRATWHPTVGWTRGSAVAVRWLTAHGISLYRLAGAGRARPQDAASRAATPVNLLELDGERYLVAPRGNTQWVRNARAAGGGRAARWAQRTEAGRARRAARRPAGAGAAGLPHQVGLGGRPVRRGPVQEVHRRRDRRRSRPGCRSSIVRTAGHAAADGCPRDPGLARVGPVSDALVHRRRRPGPDRRRSSRSTSPPTAAPCRSSLVAGLAGGLADAAGDESAPRRAAALFVFGDLRRRRPRAAPGPWTWSISPPRHQISLQRTITALRVPVVTPARRPRCMQTAWAWSQSCRRPRRQP